MGEQTSPWITYKNFPSGNCTVADRLLCSCPAPGAEGILQELMQLERSINPLDTHQPPRAGCHRLCFLISTTHAPTLLSYYVAASGNISRSPKQIEIANRQLTSITPFPMHGLHQIPFATGMEELAFFQEIATAVKPKAK